MFIDQCRNIGFLKIAIPYPIRINGDRRPFAAASQTAGTRHLKSTMQTFLAQSPLQLFGDDRSPLAIAIVIGADQDMLFDRRVGVLMRFALLMGGLMPHAP